MTRSTRYAIVTPYYKEDRSLLQRCIDSVRNQTVSTEHILVADGIPQDWIDHETVRHLKLDRTHGDYGNTPRGIGAMLAISGGYDGIGLLDADNWIENKHVEFCVAAASKGHGDALDCDYVIAARRFRRPDGSVLPILDEPGHVDTNCLFFFRGSYHVIPYWGLMPKPLSPICDRIYYEMLKRQPLRSVALRTPTVNYSCLWESFYRTVGETPPAEAKPNISGRAIADWLNALSPRELEIATRLAGSVIDLQALGGNGP